MMKQKHVIAKSELSTRKLALKKKSIEKSKEKSL